MTTEVTEQKMLSPEKAIWEPPGPPTDLVFDDGEPLKTNRHRMAMNVLICSLKHGWTERQDVFVSGNMFVYYSDKQVRNRDFRGPDFFVVLAGCRQQPRAPGVGLMARRGTLSRRDCGAAFS